MSSQGDRETISLKIDGKDFGATVTSDVDSPTAKEIVFDMPLPSRTDDFDRSNPIYKVHNYESPSRNLSVTSKRVLRQAQNLFTDIPHPVRFFYEVRTKLFIFQSISAAFINNSTCTLKGLAID